MHCPIPPQYTASDFSYIQSQAYFVEISCYLCLHHFYQEALSPGAEFYGNKLYGVMPPITVEEATALGSEGYSETDDFRMGRRKQVKQVEVFLLQLLNLYVAIPLARYGKDISVGFGHLDDIDNKNWPLFHVHDFGPHLKNAEHILMELHHKMETILLLCSLPAMTKYIERYPKAFSIVQYYKMTHNDELFLQRVSDLVIDALKETKHLLKIDLPKIKRPWLGYNHVTISKEGVVFATDDFYKTVFFFS